MSRRLTAAAALLVLATPAPALAGPLARYAPVVAHDSREPDPLTSVRAFSGRVPGVPSGRARPVVYGRWAGPWLQYGPLGRLARELDPRRDRLAARPGVQPAGSLERPGGVGRRRAAMHAAQLQPARGVRRPRDGDGG